MEKKEIIQVGVPGAREKFEEWIKERGGVQVWNNLNLNNPDAGQQFTPALERGVTSLPYPKPHWSMGRGEVITDIARFRFVKAWKEVNRFRVGIRMGRQGLSMKVTDGGTRRIYAALARAKEKYHVPASYYFDYGTQEAVIEVPEFEP